MQGIWKRFPAGRWITIVGVLVLVGVLAVASLQLFPAKGWSKDVVVSNGQMTMIIQFKADPAPPVAGPITLMARIKDAVGYTARVHEVLFTYSQASQGFTQTKEGVPIGKFGTQGEGLYTTPAELPFPGDWQVEIEVNHGGSKFNATFLLTVKAQQ